ncbi:MAG: PQQ-like beta-propeller repeat protein [Ignavibacteriales bacterium]|nr:PQQ-like beta-propeller repeat protein [Ignavibacteriales bacterium]
MKYSITFISIFLSVLLGCNKLILRQPVISDVKDWKVFAGSKNRLNFTDEELKPPLVKAWEYDASAGFGQFGVTINGNIICVGNLRGEVHLVDKINGKGLGMKDFGTAIYSPPILDDNILFIALSDDKENLFAYDLTRGSIIWKKSVGRIESAILLLNNKIIVNTIDNGLLSIDKNDATVIWKFPQTNSRIRTKSHSSPAASGETIVYGNDDGLIVALNSQNGSVCWQKQVGGSLIAAPSIRDYSVFIGTLEGRVVSLELATGDILWSTEVGGKIYSSFALTNASIFVVTSKNEMLCLNKNSGDIIWRTLLDGVLGSSPLLAGNILYVGSFDKNLYAIESTSGKVIWKFKADGRVVSSPVLNNGLLYILIDDNSLIALRRGDDK